MHYSLVLIGAHDGRKTEQLVKQAAGLGRVLLIEPVPWLFAQLENRYRGHPNVTLLQSAVSESDTETVEFYAPTESANEVQGYGDQLGSLNPSHATEHDPRFSEKISRISVPNVRFGSLLSRFDVSSIDTLMTDTEGYDARILATFPFSRFRPRQILFEFKHSDGVFHIGRLFANLLILLEVSGYKTRAIDAENCLATLSN